MPMIMHIVLFSGLSDSDLAIIFAIVSVIHAVLALVFATLAIIIAAIFTKRKIAYWPVFLCAFLLGEVFLFWGHRESNDETYENVPFAFIYIVIMIIGFTGGIFYNLAKNKDHDKTQS